MKETKSRYAVLGMLSIGPMSGYDIKKRVEQSVGNFWSESYGQIYPILKGLVGEGLVTKTVERQSGKPDRHVYALTQGGREELRRWLGEGVVPKVERNEFLLKLFFGGEAGAATSLRHVEVFREVQLKLLEKYEAIEGEIKSGHAADPNLPYWLMTLDYGRCVSQAVVGWCDRIAAKLNKLAKQDKKRVTGRKKP